MENTRRFSIVLAMSLFVVVPSLVNSSRDIHSRETNVTGQFSILQRNSSESTSRSTDEPRYVEGEVLVKFKNDRIDFAREGAEGKAASLYRAKHVEEKMKILPLNAALLTSRERTTEDLVADFRRDSSVEYAEPNYLVEAALTPNDTNFTNLWGLNNTGQTVNGTAGTADADIDAPEAWNLSTGSTSVVVAVLDTGIAINHPDLAGNIVAGYDFVNNDSTPEDLNDHGTHVAGTISAVGNNATGVAGVNWNVKIMPLRVLGADGSGSTATIATAVTYAAQNGAHVINMSLGGTGYSQTFYDAINTARSAGVLVVVAAGNSTNNNDGGTHFYPCDYDLDNIICVAATDQNDALASFSNYGTTSVDVAAPGVNIYSTMPYHAFTENFNGATTPGFTGAQFTSSGSSNYWMTYGSSDIAAYGDTNSYPYQNNSNGVLTSSAVDTSSYDVVWLQYDYAVESEFDASCTKDYLLVEVYNGSGWTEVKRYCGTGTSGTETLNVSSYKNASMRVRFQWVSNGSDSNYFGAGVDNVRFIPPNSATADYQFLQGTSMASPQVAGLAALLKSYKSTFTYSGIRNTILNNVDAKAGLASKVVTGGRINAFTSLSNVDNGAPTATVSYSTTAPTNQNVTATLVPGETVTVTNNGGSASRTFTENGSFDFTFTDLAGNTGSATAAVANIDKTAPVITVAPYTTATTNQDVTVTATTNEGTLNAASYTFTANGSFNFVATDAAGNSTTSTVTITNIDKTAPVITLTGNAIATTNPGRTYVDAGATALDDVDGDISARITVTSTVVTSTVGEYSRLFSVTDQAGNAATATRKVIVAAQSTAITVTSGAYTATFNGKKRTIRPLGSYAGRVFARKMVVRKYNEPIYVFVPLDPQTSPTVVVVDYKGNVIRRTSLSSFSTTGFNADAVADGVYAFVALGPAASNSTARVYRLTATATSLVSSLTQSTKGTVFVKFLRLFSTPGQQYGLATAIKGNATSIRVWRYNPTTKKFTRVTTYKVKNIILGSAGLSLKTGTTLVP